MKNNYKRTEQQKRNLSEIMKAKILRGDLRRDGKFNPNFGHKNTEKTKAKMRESALKKFEKFPEKMHRWMDTGVCSNKTKSKYEAKVNDILKRQNIKFIPQFRVGRKRADFYLSDLNLIIEVDGEYFHNYPFGTENDRKKDVIYKEKGFGILRIWAHTIETITDEQLIKLIYLQSPIVDGHSARDSTYTYNK